jgi:uroporphyrinogen III methyltransferase/synthase
LQKQGKVYLVGAGPGDPGLITVKGLACLQQADVVIYDRLVDERLLDEAPPRAEKIYVGKASNHHLWKQEAINRLLLEKARKGKRVVRLKGGDPFVLGRGGEEAEFLARHCIPFEVIPGVSSAYAVPAYAGIPVTYRGLASSFTVVTGHKALVRNSPSIAWDKISKGTDTLVVLMGLTNLGYVVDQLRRSDLPASTPIAVITHGTTSRQECVVGTLKSIVTRVESKKLTPPAVVVIGKVVKFHKRLYWFDSQLKRRRSRSGRTIK